MNEIKNEILAKAGFLLYNDYWEKYFCKMSGEQIKETMKIIFHFNRTYEILETSDLAIDMVVATIIDSIKRDAQKRMKQSRASRENGKKGGRGNKSKNKFMVSNLLNQDKDISNKTESSNSLIDSNFQEFWNFYTPICGKDGTFTQKGNRANARNIYNKCLEKGFKHEKIMECLRFYLEDCEKNARYTKQVATWLNTFCKDGFEYEQSTPIQSKKLTFLTKKQEDQEIYNNFLKKHETSN